MPVEPAAAEHLHSQSLTESTVLWSAFHFTELGVGSGQQSVRVGAAAGDHQLVISGLVAAFIAFAPPVAYSRR
jgi:hypothetical protein